MSNEIRFPGNSSYAYYLVILNASGQYYNYLTSAFENYNSANWIYTKYCHSLSDVNSLGAFVTDFPALSVGNYTVNIYRQSGGSPATSDKIKGQSVMYWSGTAEITDATLKTLIDSLAANNLTLGQTGTIQASPAPTTTSFQLDLTSTIIAGQRFVVMSGGAILETRRIASVTAGLCGWAVALSVAPSAGDTVLVIGV